MYVDVVIATDAAVTNDASNLYLQLNSGSDQFTEGQQNGNAPFGGATGGHQVLRERVTVWWNQTAGLTGDPWKWTDVQFVKTTNANWVCLLTQNVNLIPDQWYLGDAHTSSFGTGTGQQDLTTVDIEDISARVETLTDEATVERLLLSHLQGRMRFDDHVPIDNVDRSVMSYDDLWDAIYAKSAVFQNVLNKWYVTPVLLTNAATRHMLREIVAKSVAVDLFRSYMPVTGTQPSMDRVLEWAREVDAFLAKPPDLPGATRHGVGGTFELVRA